jgi:hypothetical protein
LGIAKEQGRKSEMLLTDFGEKIQRQAEEIAADIGENIGEMDIAI